METSFRKVVQVGLAALALSASGFAFADGITGRVAGKAREQAQSQRSEEPRRESRPAPRNESRPEARPAPRAEAPPAPRAAPSREAQAPRAQAPRVEASRAQAPRAEVRRGDRNFNGNPPNANRDAAPGAGRRPDAAQAERRRQFQAGEANSAPAPSAPAARAGSGAPRAAPSGERGVTGRIIDREFKDRNPRPDRDRHARDRNGRDWDRDRNANRDRDDRRRIWRERSHEHDRARHRHVHVIHHLPAGYRDYWWNGSRYVYHGGYWYRPYGTSYISVRVPYGFFVTTLPGSFTSVWVGGTRYYYSDYTYYVYEPERRGYVVVQSPYGEEDEGFQDELFIYPAQGQSAEQQSEDRYQCHRWAVDQTDYDPLDDAYDSDLHEEYLRAMTACLEGRGYTVR